VTTALRPARTRLALLTAVALAGAVDVAAFAAAEPAVAFKDGGRATGTLFGLAVWVLLTGAAGRRWRRPESGRLALATLGLGGLAALDGVGLAAIHMAVGVGGWRPLVGGILGVAALGLAITTRRGEA
jgi:hypothetical protein